MTFLSKPPGGSGAGEGRPPRDLASLVSGLSAPGVQVLTTAQPSNSYLGGHPQAPAGFQWPEKDGVPLGFLGCLDLAEVAAARRLEWLPAQGGLLFFYDVDAQPWGFDPKDAGSWRVIYLGPDESRPVEIPPPATLSEEQVLPKAVVAFRPIDTLPSAQRDEMAALALTDEEGERLIELQDQGFGGQPRHQIGGFPIPIQGDQMELESQLASNGLFCGDSSGYEDPRAQALEPGAKDWRLLFQFDSDDELGTCWGDVGTLYFWIREQDARAKCFDRAWLILQCS